jgi:Uma2 family endonuclease
MSVPLKRHHFNVAEYYRMAETGILKEGDRVELIEGEIVEMSPIGSHHAACVDRAGRALNQRIGKNFIVRVQNPIRLSDLSEPQPDLALLRPRADFYEQSHPTPDDVLLVIEVADTAVAYDRGVKVPLYARSGIAEVWLVDLTQERIEIYTQPAGASYRQMMSVARGESFASPTVGGLALDAEDVLG